MPVGRPRAGLTVDPHLWTVWKRTRLSLKTPHRTRTHTEAQPRHLQAGSASELRLQTASAAWAVASMAGPGSPILTLAAALRQPCPGAAVGLLGPSPSLLRSQAPRVLARLCLPARRGQPSTAIHGPWPAPLSFMSITQ